MTEKFYTTYYPNGKRYIKERRVDGKRVGVIFVYSGEYNTPISELRYSMHGVLYEIHNNGNIRDVIDKVKWSKDGELTCLELKMTYGSKYIKWYPNGQIRSYTYCYIYGERKYHCNANGLSNIKWYPDRQLALVEYYLDNEPHNDTGPSRIVWDEFGNIVETQYHRVGIMYLPGAEIERCLKGYISSVTYKLNNCIHREDGPAYVKYGPYNGSPICVEYRKDGKLHRDEGPAVYTHTVTSKEIKDEIIYYNEGIRVISASLKYYADGRATEVNTYHHTTDIGLTRYPTCHTKESIRVQITEIDDFVRHDRMSMGIDNVFTRYNSTNPTVIRVMDI